MHYRHNDRKLIWKVRHILSIPFIYAVFFPAVLLDIILELYHRICFPLFGMPYVKRRAYIRVDRHKLKYLRIREKINCAYCGYINGLFHYMSRIAAESEWYWCSIKHKQVEGAVEPMHHEQFLDYDDEVAFHSFVKK